MLTLNCRLLVLSLLLSGCLFLPNQASAQVLSESITHRLEQYSFADFSNGRWWTDGIFIFGANSVYHTFGDTRLDPDLVDFRLEANVYRATPTLGNQWDLQLPAVASASAADHFVGAYETNGLHAYGTFTGVEAEGLWFHERTLVRDRSMAGTWDLYEENYYLFPKSGPSLPPMF